MQLVSELRGALAAAADKVDELEEKEKATAAAHKKEVIATQNHVYSSFSTFVLLLNTVAIVFVTVINFMVQCSSLKLASS